MNKKLLCLMLVPFLLMGCTGGNTPGGGQGGDDSGDHGGSGGGGDGGGSGGGGGDVDPEKGNEYDYWCNSWSKPGHLYFHYNRGDKGGYQDYALWLWPYYPDSLEGTLWAYDGTTQISDTLTLRPMSDHWMTNAEVGKEGTGMYVDDYGVIADVDYKSSSLVGGKTGKPVSFEGSEEIGFLLPIKSKMDGSSMWVSDGGKETYVTDIMDEKNWRDIDNALGKGKACHIFVSSGQLNKHSYYVGDGTPEVKVNPIDSDTTGNYRSEIVNYSSTYGLSSTSEAFKQYGVGYQVFVASFRDSNNDGVGDIRGIIDSLDYLEDLGAEVLWLTPIQKSDSYHGYDISDYYAVDKRFGTIEDYRELIYKAHQRGMRVLMDLVLNHTSKNNVWFTKSQWGETSKGPNGQDINWRNVYTWKFESDTIEKYQNGQYVTMTVKQDAESANPSWYRDGESHYYYYGKFGSGMPEINYQNAATRELVIDMAKYWMSFGLDGFRLDAVKHIFMRDEAYTAGDQVITDVGQKRAYDEEKGQYITKDFDYSSNLTKNIMWWKEFAVEVKNEYPNCFLVGENFDGWGTRTAPYYQALDSQFDFANYYHIASMLYNNAGGASAWQYTHPAETYVPFASSDYYPLGDTGISVQGGCRPDFIDGAFTSNHDVMRAINQVNGTPTGSPGETVASTHITGAGDEVNKAKIHAAVTLLNQGISWIYYGDELGMSSNTYKHIEMYGSENNEDIWYRQPFLWQDTTKRAHYKMGQYVFELDDYNLTLPTMEQQKDQQDSMLNWYKALIQIKKAYPANATVTFSANSGVNVMVIKVTGNGKTVGIWINTGVNTNDYSVNPSDVLGTDQYDIIGQLGPQPVGGYNIGGAKFSVLALRAK